MCETDQATSLETPSLNRLVRDIRIVEKAMGNVDKTVRPSELPVIDRLRRMQDF